MAMIHRAANPARQELDSYVKTRLAQRRLSHERIRQSRPRDICIAAIVLAVCVCAVALLWNCPGILDTAQSAVKGTIHGWSDWLLSYELPRDALNDQPFLARIFWGILGLGLVIVLMIFGFLLYFVAILSVPVVTVLCYGIPIVIGLGAIAVLFDDPGDFDAVAETQRIFDSLPEEYRIALSGMEGEEEALRILSGLDDQCHIYANLLIPHDGKVSETDLIAVTPGGITIVEVKNHKNTIVGDLSDHDLVQQHISPHGKLSEKTFYNPVKQVGTHVYRLSHYLKANGIFTNIHSCVYFVNDQSELHLTDREKIAQSCPVFHGSSADIRRHLYAAHTSLSPRQMQSITAALDWLVAHPPSRAEENHVA